MQLRVAIHQRDFRITEHTALKKKIQTKQGSCILTNVMQLNLKVNIPVLKKTVPLYNSPEKLSAYRWTRMGSDLPTAPLPVSGPEGDCARGMGTGRGLSTASQPRARHRWQQSGVQQHFVSSVEEQDQARQNRNAITQLRRSLPNSGSRHGTPARAAICHPHGALPYLPSAAAGQVAGRRFR